MEEHRPKKLLDPFADAILSWPEPLIRLHTSASLSTGSGQTHAEWLGTGRTQRGEPARVSSRWSCSLRGETPRGNPTHGRALAGGRASARGMTVPDGGQAQKAPTAPELQQRARPSRSTVWRVFCCVRDSRTLSTGTPVCRRPAPMASYIGGLVFGESCPAIGPKSAQRMG